MEAKSQISKEGLSAGAMGSNWESFWGPSGTSDHEDMRVKLKSQWRSLGSNRTRSWEMCSRELQSAINASQGEKAGRRKVAKP